MADSGHYSAHSDNLIECRICQLLIEEPKQLPCLHSFCLSCLTEWKQHRQTDSISCPICAKHFLLPPNGVQGFTSNMFISKLIQKKSSIVKPSSTKNKDAKVLCICCQVIQTGIDGYCIDCIGFVCQMCAIMHNTLKPLSDHKIIPMEDIQSGKIDVNNLSKQKCCKTHQGQILWFFCNTCGLIICRDCTVVDHPASSHNLVNLKSVTKEQINDILQLAHKCQVVEIHVAGVMRDADEVKDNLNKALNEAKEEINKTFDGMVSILKIKQADLLTQLNHAGLERKKQICAVRDNLLSQHTRLNSALQMAHHVTGTGSHYDIAMIYASLKNSLSKLQDITPIYIDKSLGMLKFNSHQTGMSSMPNLGSLQLGSCKLVKSFGGDGDGKLNGGRGIAVTQDGDIAVADCNSLGKVMIYDKNGTFKLHLDTTEGLKSDQMTYPWDIAVSTNGDFYVTHLAPHVNVYGSDGKYKHQFPIISPTNVPSDREDTSLYGLTIDNKGNLLVGEAKQQYISRHHTDGTHISSFKVAIKPFFVSMTPKDEIIISCQDLPQSVQILNHNGLVLRTLKPPENMKSCHGLCCPNDYEIYAVYMSSTSKGVYCYSASGDLLGCMTEEVCYPWGIALTEGGSKMLVVENEYVKIFSLK